jgi:hypothetical protein
VDLKDVRIYVSQRRNLDENNYESQGGDPQMFPKYGTHFKIIGTARGDMQQV